VVVLLPGHFWAVMWHVEDSRRVLGWLQGVKDGGLAVLSSWGSSRAVKIKGGWGQREKG